MSVVCHLESTEQVTRANARANGWCGPGWYYLTKTERYSGPYETCEECEAAYDSYLAFAKAKGLD